MRHNAFFAPFDTKTRTFAKTGSGRTKRETSPRNDVFLAATTLWAVRGAGEFWDEHSTGHNFVNSSTAENHWVDDGQDHNQSYLVLKGTNQSVMAAQVAGVIDGLMCKGGPADQIKSAE